MSIGTLIGTILGYAFWIIVLALIGLWIFTKIFGTSTSDNSVGQNKEESANEKKESVEELAYGFLSEYLDVDPGELVQQAYAFIDKRDWPRAVACYQSAATRGNADEQADLAYLYENGHGVPVNYEKAVMWYQKAAEQDHGAAQLALGKMYIEGKGVSQNNSLSFSWMIKAAEKGYADAQCAVGTMYYGGMGVEEDDHKAAEWYRRAAEQGNAPAQYHLGVMYGRGHGVEQDFFESLKWLDLAAEQGHEEARTISNNVKSVVYK